MSQHEGEQRSLILGSFPFEDIVGTEVLLVTVADQLNILGQTFRPIFTGTVAGLTVGFLTLDPVIIKMSNAPFYHFPTPLNFPLEKITFIVPFDPDTKIPLT
ncbi:hypothetical protein [Geomicrobium sp. JCM 19055]|uniref:hypothetical protein n=1 Tax=Geomicrobium sp. JCM 19055 TaxID=1460649 RepID=UPI00045EDD19|nr:hypothetical protein [Geomicrobium sp. JCM 19055]GAJ99808.1 hypothetical protein JCM19055_2850 [Geomicrobium sp. JCM 19055]